MLMNWCVHSAQAGSLKWVDPKTKKRLAKAAKAAAAKAEKEAAKASMPKAERKVKEKKEKKEKVKKPKKEKKASETFCIWSVLSKWCSAASMPFFVWSLFYWGPRYFIYHIQIVLRFHYGLPNSTLTSMYDH